MDKPILLGLALIGLTVVNVYAYRELGFLGLLVTAASVPFVDQILGIIKDL